MSLKVSEVFDGISGEGENIGIPATFIRLQGCSVGCKFCDTSYAQDFSLGDEMDEDDIRAKISQPYVILTGGEPLEQDINPLVDELSSQGLFISLETSGQFWSTDAFSRCNLLSVDIKPPSSGVEARMDIIRGLIQSFAHKSQFKVVISDFDDYEFVSEVYRRLGLANLPHKLILTPAWKEILDVELVRRLEERILRDRLKVRLILQQHKIIWGKRRGK
jgi:7-carboxy-7-deazaguanine synthase